MLGKIELLGRLVILSNEFLACSMTLLDQLLILQLRCVDHLLNLALEVTIDVDDALAQLAYLLL